MPNAYDAKELGCFVDGRAGTLGTTVQRRLDVIAISSFLIAARNPHRIWLALGAGRWNFVLQLRRPRPQQGEERRVPQARPMPAPPPPGLPGRPPVGIRSRPALSLMS